MQRNDVRDHWAPDRERPGLVEDDRVHPAGLLQVRPALDQDAAASAVADRRADRRRGRQAHRARAGDQQHRHRAPDIAGEGQGDCRDDERDRHEATGEVLADGLDGRAVVLRLFDAGDDAADGGLVADRTGANDQAAAQHHRTGMHRRPGNDADRQGFAGDRGLVDHGLAVDHVTVDRYRDVVVDHHVVADLHGVDRHLDLVAVVQPDPRGVVGAAQQIRDGPPGPAQGQILKVFTDIEQPQHGECDHVLAQHQAGDRRRGDQRIGARAPGPQAAQCAAQERVAHEHRRSGRDQLAGPAQQGWPVEGVAAHPKEGQRCAADHHPQHLGVADIRRPWGASRNEFGGNVFG